MRSNDLCKSNQFVVRSAWAFVNRFANVAENIYKTLSFKDKNVLLSLLSKAPSIQNKLFFDPVTYEVHKINAQTLLSTIDIITLSLSNLMNLCYSTGIVTALMKISGLPAILRKENSESPNKYLPISSIPLLSNRKFS